MPLPTPNSQLPYIPGSNIPAFCIKFYDLGIRNAVIENFNELNRRSATGQIWENFLIIERLKAMSYRKQFANRYFWRTYTGAELDYVEESGGQLNAYEFKWGKKAAKAPRTWMEAYPGAGFQSINRKNYLEFLLGE